MPVALPSPQPLQSACYVCVRYSGCPQVREVFKLRLLLSIRQLSLIQHMSMQGILLITLPAIVNLLGYVPEWILDVNSCLQICSIPVQCPTYGWTSSCVCPTYDWTSSCVCPTYDWTSSCVCPTYEWTSSCVCPTYGWTSSCIVSRVHGYITCVVCSRVTHINTVVTVVSTVPGLQQPPLPLVHAVYVQYICMYVAVGLCSSLHDCF